MRLEIDTDTGEAHLSDCSNLRKLDAVVAGKPMARKILPSFVRLDNDGKHAWIAISSLKERGYPHDAAWTREFDGMIAYARSKGWIDASDMVRVHIADGHPR